MGKLFRGAGWAGREGEQGRSKGVLSHCQSPASAVPRQGEGLLFNSCCLQYSAWFRTEVEGSTQLLRGNRTWGEALGVCFFWRLPANIFPSFSCSQDEEEEEEEGGG